MRDILSVVGGQEDELQKAEGAIRAIGAERAAEWREALLRGSFEEAVARMSTYAQLEPGAEPDPGSPVQDGGDAPGFVTKVGGVKCWFGTAMLDGELAWLVDNDRSTVRHEVGGESRAMAREIVARVSGSVGGPLGRGLPAVAVVWDPLGSVGRHGGLGEALAELGRRCPQLSAVVLAGGGEPEVHGVPGSASPLGDGAREAILRAASGAAR